MEAIDDREITEEDYEQNHAKIATFLLERNADINSQAQARENCDPPYLVKIGQTPMQMLDVYRNMPWYYYSGIRDSYAYTGEQVWLVIAEHLHIPQNENNLCALQ